MHPLECERCSRGLGILLGIVNHTHQIALVQCVRGLLEREVGIALVLLGQYELQPRCA